MPPTNFEASAIADVLVEMHIKHLGEPVGIDMCGVVFDQISGIRNYLSQIGLHFSAREWPDFIRSFCDVEADGSIRLNRPKLLMSRQVPSEIAARLLVDEIRKNPELFGVLKKVACQSSRGTYSNWPQGAAH